jgi:hypothetical protein
MHDAKKTQSARLPPGWVKHLAQVPERVPNGSLRYLYRCVRCDKIFRNDESAGRGAAAVQLREDRLAAFMQMAQIDHLDDLPRLRCPFCSVAGTGRATLEEYTLPDGSGVLGYRFSWDSLSGKHPGGATCLILRPGCSPVSYRQPLTDEQQALDALTWLTTFESPHAAEPCYVSAQVLGLGDPDRGRLGDWIWHADTSIASIPFWPDETLTVHQGVAVAENAVQERAGEIAALWRVAARLCFADLTQLREARAQKLGGEP